ncbi:MAG TPA: carboxypeptidase-like regulatory domain-containing protein [Xanthobacteraceae bacterium]|jgi:hypothetical protein
MTPPCNCNECVPDPNFTCSYTGQEVSVTAVYIANAYKGNLILCPGGANGLIGGLLNELTPPQHYSHMGIMVADFDLIRHCTASQEWLTSDEYYTGSVLGVSAPVDGLNPDHLQFGWPGAVTQSTEQIFFADRYGDQLTPPGLQGPYRGSHLPDPESPSGKTYQIAAMSFEGLRNGDSDYFPALVVKPCPFLETPAITEALGHVADAALNAYSHYRFYCYTNGEIGSDPGYSGPPRKLPSSQPDWDSERLKWKDWTDPMDVKWVHTATTPAVCSSFVWQAVRDASDARLPRLKLDWAESHRIALGADGGRCPRAVPPDWSGDVLGGSDGLYSYDEASREKAGKWLNESLSQQVYDSLKGALAGKGGVMKVIANAIDDVGRGAFIAAAADGATALVSLLMPLLGPAGPVLDVGLAEQLIELLYDMPNHIANQVCNSFAFDCHRGFPGDTRCVDAAGNEIRDVDSDNWSTAAGRGNSVSPDNIHMFWDAPSAGSSRDRVFGLYGYNVPVLLVVGVVRRPLCEIVPSTGTATISGKVVYEGQSVAGAYVKVGCQYTTQTNVDHTFTLTVRSGGQYKVVARFEDPANRKVLYGEATTGKIAAGDDLWVQVFLSSPPECMRNVVIQGQVRVDDVYLTGADHKDNFFNTTLFVQYGVPAFDEATGKWRVLPDDPATGVARRTDIAQADASKGDAFGRLNMQVEVKEDLSVDVTLIGILNPDDDNLASAPQTVNVLPGATLSVADFELDNGGSFPDRAYFRNITIANQAAAAI